MMRNSPRTLKDMAESSTGVKEDQTFIISNVSEDNLPNATNESDNNQRD